MALEHSIVLLGGPLDGEEVDLVLASSVLVNGSMPETVAMAFCSYPRIDPDGGLIRTATPEVKPRFLVPSVSDRFSDNRHARPTSRCD